MSNINFNYFSQESLLKSGCFDIPMAIKATEDSLLSFRKGEVLFPDKIVQIFNKETQNRINCLPSTILPENICGMKWVSVFTENPQKHNVQNLSALIVLSELEKGFPLAVMEGTLCSNLRVAAMGGTAAKYLARKDSEIIGFIGAGEQAKMHLLAMKSAVPNLKECRISSKTEDEENSFINEMSKVIPDMKFVATKTNSKGAIKDADILVTATSAQAPLLKADWVKPGAFYSHIGGWEDEFEVAKQCDKIVCDSWETVKHRTQTLSRMYQANELSDDDIHANIDEIVAGIKVGRENESEKIYFNAVGLSYVDVSIATAMFKRALNFGEGKELNLQQTAIFKNNNIKNFLKI